MSAVPNMREQAISAGFIRPVPFDLWIKEGAVEQEGKIDFVIRFAGIGYVFANKFPDRRLFFRVSDLPKWFWSGLHRGTVLIFDVPAQYQPNHKAVPFVKARRLLLPKGK